MKVVEETLPVNNEEQVENIQDFDKEIHNFEVVQELENGKSITIIRSTDEDLQQVEDNDLEYQINFIMNEEEPAKEIVIHEQDC